MIDLDAIDARCTAATPGPWGVEPYGESVFSLTAGEPCVCEGGVLRESDAFFIAHARADIEQMAQALREAESILRSIAVRPIPWDAQHADNWLARWFGK